MSLGALLIGLTGAAWGQLAVDDPDWKEVEVPPPPAFDVSKLVTFEVSRNAALVYGVDPAAIHISSRDSVVRYVMVASSASGATNIMYEGIRCATGEFKTYARYSSDGRWRMVDHAEWRSLYSGAPSRHALQFAKAGACENAAPASTVEAIVSRLKGQH
ncbi:MAG: CNP1-like family protein [Polaromonas sp.]|nr:CNP1-like family protein [Polaromonas sp.]